MASVVLFYQALTAAGVSPSVSVGVGVQATVSASSTATQKLPVTCAPLTAAASHAANVAPSVSSVHLANSNLSIQLKPLTPRMPLIQIRHEAGTMLTLFVNLFGMVSCLILLCFHRNMELLFIFD